MIIKISFKIEISLCLRFLKKIQNCLIKETNSRLKNQENLNQSIHLKAEMDSVEKCLFKDNLSEKFSSPKLKRFLSLNSLLTKD